jgi:hypothetical protein
VNGKWNAAYKEEEKKNGMRESETKRERERKVGCSFF